MKKNIISITFLFLVFLSCSDDDSYIPNNYTSFFGVSDFLTAQSKAKDYSIFSVLSNGAVLIRNSSFLEKNNLIKNPSLYATYIPDKSDRSRRADVGTFHINEAVLEFENGGYSPKEKLPTDFVDNLFNSYVAISLKSNEEKIIDVSFQTPKYLDALDLSTATPIDTTSEVKWLEKKDNILKWNRDETNENGLLLVMSSRKEKFGELEPKSEQTSYKFIYINEDTGSFTIPASFFDDISSQEYLTLTLYRGAFEYISDDGNGKDFKFYILSDISGQFVLR